MVLQSERKFWKCTVCGEIFEGEVPPEVCPVCGAGPEAFITYSPETVKFRNDREMRVVIAGGGAAAVAAAKAIRERNSLAVIEIYSRETTLPYYRPLLTAAIAARQEDARFYICPPDFYREQKIVIRNGIEVTAVTPSERMITLNDGSRVGYDKLLLATGGRCFLPPIQGVDLPEVVTLREKRDLDKLLGLSASGRKNIVVIGGGLLGLENADALSRAGHRVTVLESCPVILPRQMDREGAPLLQTAIEANPRLKVRHGVFVAQICGVEKVVSVKTGDGEEFPCDIVIIAAGVRSNTALADAAGLRVEKAIAVDTKMRTSNRNIHAAGDCAACDGVCYGLWETALEQGRIAGANIAGEKINYRPKIYGTTMNAFGVRLFAIGDLGFTEAAYRQSGTRNELQKTYKKLYFKDGVLVGGILLGDVSLTNPLLHGVNARFSVQEATAAGLM